MTGKIATPPPPGTHSGAGTPGPSPAAGFAASAAAGEMPSIAPPPPAGTVRSPGLMGNASTWGSGSSPPATPPPPSGAAGEVAGPAPPPVPGTEWQTAATTAPPQGGFAGSPEAVTGAPPPVDLQLQLDGLRQQVRAGRRRSFLLGNGVIATVLLAILCWAAFHAAVVFQYAQLDPAIQIQRDGVDPDRLALLYRPLSDGKVGFRRTDVDRQTELLDSVVPPAVGKHQEFQWRVGGLQEGDLIGVTFRQGFSLVTKELRVPAPPPEAVLGDGSLSGEIVNATNNEPVPNAEVRVVGTGLATRTDDQGRFRLDATPTGSVPVEVSAPGFTAEQFERELAGGREQAIRVVLSPGMEAGQMRIVLTWGDDPADLDAHLKGPLPDGEGFHVYFHQKGDLKSKEFVRLDVDDQNGQGPETITVLGVLPGTYRYFVHDYTNCDDPQTSSLAQSGAEVKLYQGGQTYRFRAGHDMVGNLWNVCTIEVTPEGAIVTKTDTYEGTEVEALGLYAKRTMADRGQWIGGYGGNLASESAVDTGLEWLARHQGTDGSWHPGCLGAHADSRCKQGAFCTGEGKTYEMAQTGLALLAFQAGGHYDFNGNTYSDVVRQGLDWLVAHQRPDGGLIGSMPKGGQPRFHKHYMYEHGIAAFALVEACAVAAATGGSESRRYREPAEKAIQFIYDMQHTDGGWRYTDDLKRSSDTSVTGWQVLALKSAKEAGIPIREECVEKVRKFFDYRAMGENGRTGYNDRIPLTEATTGVGMLARQFLLGEPDAPLVRDAAAFLADYAEQKWSDRQAEADNKDFYLWYNCTLGMFQAGGEPWQRWNPIVRDTIIGLQRHDGCARGSWDPSSKWGEPGGRIYTTALAALTLEVYYRYASHEEAADSFGGNVTTLEEFEARPQSELPAREPVELPAREPSELPGRKPVELDARDRSGVEVTGETEPTPAHREPVELNARDENGGKHRKDD